MVKSTLRHVIFSLLCLLSISLPFGRTYAAILQIDNNGILTGASGVVVRGLSYDVEFLTGQCLDIYECQWDPVAGERPEAVNFFFDKFILAEAMFALHDQVFIDGLTGNFATNPALINGCQNISIGSCRVQSPITHQFTIGEGSDIWIYLISVPGSAGPPGTEPSFEYTFASVDYANAVHGNRTWARWSTSVVPVPGAMWLFGSGLIGLMGMMRRRKA